MVENLPAHSFDEWTQLEEVVLGTVDGFRGFHLDSSFNLFHWDNIQAFLRSKDFFRDQDGVSAWPQVHVDDDILDELTEDLTDFACALSALGVTVRRPSALVGPDEIMTPFWRSIQSPPLNVRDQAIILGSTIVETAPHVRARLFENDYLKPVFMDYMAGGSKWLCMPRPTLAAGVLDASFFRLNVDERESLQDTHATQLAGLDREIVFDGAQCIRLGLDVLVNVGNQNHELGFDWLKRVFEGTFTFHRLERLADSHIDSTLLPLRPGLWLVRDRQCLSRLPAPFRNWDVIVAPEASEDLFPSYANRNLAIASRFIDMNVLSVNEHTVVVNSLFPDLMRALDRAGFDVVGVRHRHRRLFGGGFHCFTLDTRRTGGPQSYAS